MVLAIRRRFSAFPRELLIRLSKFTGLLITFSVITLSSALILHFKLSVPFFAAIYESFALMFFASSLPYPQNDPALQLLWLFLPFTGLLVFAQSFASLGEAIKLGDITSEEWNTSMAKIMRNHTVIVGLGNVGIRVLEQLIENGDTNVVCVDLLKDDNINVVRTIQQEYKIPIIEGHGEDQLVLQKAGIEDAKSILVLIDNDLLNLKIAMLAKRLNPDIRTVLRIFDTDFAALIMEKFAIDEALSTTRIAAPKFVEAIEPDLGTPSET